MSRSTQRRPPGRRRIPTDRGQDNDAILYMVFKTAIDSLVEAEGRASGLKFNKLVFEIHRALPDSPAAEAGFTLPYRWYLHGAVIDAFTVRNLVRFDRPEEDETRMNVYIAPEAEGRPFRDDMFSARECVLSICHEFVRQYCQQESHAEMLRDHYQWAPLQFQRDFLDWTLLVEGILSGHNLDVPDLVLARYDSMVRSFPPDFPPALAAAASRLALYQRPSLLRRRFGEYAELVRALAATWDLWSTFGLFLSTRYNEGIQAQTLARYRQRADTELPAYLRRLGALLEQGYLSELPEGREPVQMRGPIAEFVASEAMNLLGHEEY